MENNKKEKKESSAPWEGGAGPIYQRGNPENLEKLLEENLKLTKEIHKMTKKVKNYVVMARVMGILKILLVVVPIILGYVYLQPILKNVMEQYKNLLGFGQESKDLIQDVNSGEVNLGGIDVNQLSPELRKLIGK